MTIVGSIIGTGQGFQLFYQKDNQPGEYADAAARDLYFGANPDELLRLDQNQFLIIKLNDNGSGQVAYQQRASGTWVDVTTIIQGETGPAGPTGNSYFFESVADRDTFFETSPNEGLLMNGLPVIVNIGNEITSTFIWGGASAPTSYDPELWRLAGSEISSGTLLLGQAGAGISSGSEILNFTAADGGDSYLQTIQYDDTGSSEPFFYDLPAIAEVTLTDVSDQVLTDPQTITAPAFANVYIKNYTVIPATSGEMRVRVWLGTDDTGPSIVDTYVTVAPGDIGVETTYEAPNNTLILTGQDTYTEFSGVQLRGGVQTLPPFTGQTLIFLKTNSWIPAKRYYLNKDDSTPAINSLFKSDGTVSQIAEAAAFVESDTTDATVYLKPITSAGIASFSLKTTLDIDAFKFYYNENSNASFIESSSSSPINILSNDVFEVLANNLILLTTQGDYPLFFTTDESIFEIQNSTNNYRFLFQNSTDNTTPLFTWTKTGTNGGTANIFLSTVSPEGVITGNGGDLCFVKAGANSDLYLKRTDGGNTGWVDLLHGTSGVQGPATSTDDAIATWNGTDGLNLNDSNAYVTTAGGQTTIGLRNAGGVTKFATTYNSTLEDIFMSSGNGVDFYIISAGRLTLEANDTITIDAGGDHYVYLRNDQSSFSLTSSTGSYSFAFSNTEPNTEPLLVLAKDHVTGGVTRLYVSNTSPEGVILASNASICSVSGANPNIYFKLTNGVNTGWQSILGDVIGPASSTDSALALFDGTTGKLLKSPPFITVSEASDTELRLKSPSATLGSQVVLESFNGSRLTLFQYDEAAIQTTLFLSGSSHSFRLDANGAVVLRTFSDDSVKINNDNASYEIYGAINNYRHEIINNQPNTNSLIRFQQTGTNGGYFDITVGTTNPEGVVDGEGGGLYIRDGGTNSKCFIKTTDTGSTGWKGFLHEGSGISSPGSSTLNAIPTFDVTTGLSLQDNPLLTYVSSSSTSYLSIQQAATGTADLFFNNAGGASVGLIQSLSGNFIVEALSGEISIEGLNGTNIYSFNGSIDIQTRTTNYTSIVHLLGDNTTPILHLNHQGTSGGTFSIFASTVAPEGVITSSGGGLCIKTGANADIYLKLTDTGNTGWIDLLHSASGVQGPGTTTDNAIAVWDGTDGLTLQNSYSSVISNANDTKLSVTNVSATGESGFEIKTNTGFARYSLTYNQSTNQVFMTTNSGASYSNVVDGSLEHLSFSNVAIGSFTNNLVELYNTGATFRIDVSANGNRLYFTNATADTFAMSHLSKLGTNGGTVDFYVTSRSPLGNIIANGGGFAFRDAGVNSNFYVKRVDGGTTGWNVGLTCPIESSTVNAIAVFDVTTGNSLTPINTALVTATAATTLIDIKPVSGSGNAEIAFRNVAGTVKTEVYYYEGADEFAIECNAVEFRLVGNNSPITFASSSVDFDLYIRNSTPLGALIGNGGDLAVNVAGTSSNLYLKRVDGGTTGWNVAITNQTESSTLNAIPVFDVTTGNSITDVNTAKLIQTAASTEFEIKPVLATGQAEINLRSSASAIKGQLYYQESINRVALEAVATDFLISNLQGPLIFASSTTDSTLYIRTTTPLNALDGDPGDKAIVVSGNASSEYINTGSTTDNRVWSKYTLDSDTNAFGGFGRLQNRVRWSEDLTQSTWVDGLGNTTIIPGATTGPNGELVDNVQWDSAGLGLRTYSLGTVQGNTYTVSFFAKHISGTNKILIVDINDGGATGLTIDSNEWQRYSAVVTAGGSAGQWLDFTHNGTSTFAIWGVQVNDGTELYPYLKTEDIARKDTTDYGLAVDGKIIFSGSSVDSDHITTNLTTGVLDGGTLSINGVDDSLIDVTAGSALIVDYSTPGSPNIRRITWDAQTVDPVLGATEFIKWIGVQESATAGVGEFVFDIEFTQLEKRTIAIVGRCWGDGVTDSITAVGQYTTSATGQGYVANDLSYILGSMNKRGNIFSANGANLLLDKSAGVTYRYAADHLAIPTAPHVHTDTAQTGITTYWYLQQNSLVADIQPDIDPDNWDDGGTKTAVPAGKYTLQRLYYYPVSQLLAPTYGQELFDSMGAAIGAAGEDIVETPQELLEGAILRGWIALKQGATALNDTAQALFKEARSIGDQPAKGTVGSTLTYRNYTVADIGASGIHYYAGFYQAPASSVTLTVGGTATQVYGIANIARGAHAFCVASGPSGLVCILTVSGTSITDLGVRTTSDSEIIVPNGNAASTNQYFETTKKWLGQVTYTLTGIGGAPFTFNYGFAKYDDFGNRNFTITDFQVIGQGAASETALDIRLMHHKPTGWTYSAGAFVPGTGFIVSLANDYSTDDNLNNGIGFAYKRTNLSTFVNGEGSEGLLVRFNTATNNSISSATIEVGALI